MKLFSLGLHQQHHAGQCCRVVHGQEALLPQQPPGAAAAPIPAEELPQEVRAQGEYGGVSRDLQQRGEEI